MRQRGSQSKRPASSSLPPSLPGLTRQSIYFAKVLFWMDARIKSGHDECVPPARFRIKKVGPPVPEWPQPVTRQILLLVADAIDRTCPVVGDEDRAVLVEDDVVRPAEIAPVAFDPAGSEGFLLGILAVGTDDHAHDTATLIFMPVPRAVFGDQDAVLVIGRELVAGVEL